ncbi:MAG: hypothetical protein AAGC93_32030, partial [Cyanobacteria bacterium P01_F01_bin.53]
IGWALQIPVKYHQFLSSIFSKEPDFSTYQQGMFLLVGTVMVSVIASLFFRPEVKSADIS